MDHPVISADSHITEPANTYVDHIDSKWKDRAPVLKNLGEEGDVFVVDGMRRPIHMGLVAAARWLLDSTIALPGVSVKFRATGQEKRLPPKMEITLFRVIQEATGNIVRHAQPENVILRLAFRKAAVTVHIADDGRGFNVDEAIASKDRPRGLGLLGMRERVESIGGTFSIVSQAEGGGTKIDIEVPLAEESTNG